MITRCMRRRLCFNILQRWRGDGRLGVVRRSRDGMHKPYATVAGETRKERTSGNWHRYGIFNKLPYPELDERRDPTVWTALLEPGLPPHLRNNVRSKIDSDLDAHDIAEILLAAQRFVTPGKGTDLLFHLGIVEGRWNAVVWIVKRLVETFGGPCLRTRSVSHTISSWESDRSLDEITKGAIDYQQLATTARGIGGSPTGSQSLEQLTDDSDRRLSRHETLGRDALGQIWRSLGSMTIACADSEIKPEILEIIAYLHHMEIMPMMIYNQKPSADITAIQQPPTLSLFSSRILTSLSDAAWRAHEKLIVEEAKAKGGEYASLRPEIPGTAYRVNVGGLRPELWLELILWSCLQGSWVVEGGEILRTIYMEPPEHQWKPMSWRQLVSFDRNGEQDWDKIEYSFNTRAPSTMDKKALDSPSVQRTISSEVVNAYIDASLSTMRLGVGEKGVAPGYVIGQLRTLQRFLDRSGLSISSGSWDAIILRFFDSQGHVLAHRGQFNELVYLSPIMGEGLESPSGQDLPAYVLDGSAAVLGLFHRALRSRIQAGDVEGAFKLFRSLQARADGNKRQSIVDFLQKQQLFKDGLPESESELFTSNFTGIDYPAFDVQIPATILGPFMDLIIDAKAYRFGKWLLYSSDLDGPVIPEHMYGEPALAPVLVRFAAETSDKNLLSKLVRTQSENAKPGEPTLPRNVLQSFFDSQVNLKRWDPAVRILEHMQDMSLHWNPMNLAQVVRIMLFHFRKFGTSDPSYDFGRARSLFSDMVSGKYDGPRGFGDRTRGQITMMVAILSVLDFHWARYCLDLHFLKGHYTFELPTTAFNLVLEGVVKAYGSTAGRRILGIFWPHSVRHAQKLGQRINGDDAGAPMMSAYRPSFLDQAERQRTVIRIPSQASQNIVMYGGLKPDMLTIRIILRCAIEEFKESEGHEVPSMDSSPDVSLPPSSSLDSSSGSDTMDGDDIDRTASGTIAWAVRCLRLLQMEDEDIITELQAVLTEDEMQSIQSKLPSLLQQTNDTEDNGTSVLQEGRSNHFHPGAATYSPFEVHGSE